MSFANGSHFPLESTAVGGDQEEGSKSELVSSDTVHSSEENKLSTVAKDDRWPGEASDQAALSSQDPVLEACEDIQELSNPLTTSGGTVLEDHVSSLPENGPDNTAHNADACSDHRPADITIQPNSSIDCSKLEVEPSELVDIKLVNMSVMDHSIANGAQVIAQTPEHLESDLQIDCEIVTQFNLEKACNIGSGSDDLNTPVTFHAAPAVKL